MRIRCFALGIFAALFSAVTAFAQTDLIGLYLSWQRDPATTMTVNWVSLYEHTPATVWYRAEGAEEWRKKSGERSTLSPSVLQVRRVELTGLKPATRYEFALTEEIPDKDTKGIEKFRTMPAALKRSVNFVAGGDMMHTREMMDAMTRQAAKLDPDFALLGGDLAYANDQDASRWIDWLQSWRKNARGKEGRLIPMVVAIGNHEVRGYYNGRVPEDAMYFYGLFALPQGRSYYALDFGQYLSLFILDTGHTQPITGAQAEWLERGLSKRADQQFAFVAYHYPAYGTSKAAEGTLPSENARAIEIRQQWLPHIERYGVSAVFEHDHHNYKRTHRIRNHQRDHENGILFLGDGAWGVNTRTVPAPGEAWYLAHAEPRRHLFHVTLHPTGRADIKAIDAEGKVFDSVTLETARTKPVEDREAVGASR